MSIDIEQFHSVFFDESDEHLDDMEQLLMSLDIESPDPEELNSIFRAAHSIKGGSGIFGFDALMNLTHVMENLLDKARNNDLNVTADIVNVLLETLDVLKDTLLPAFKQYGRVKPLKIWSAACSSGQEPYSISMAVSEFLSRNPGAFSAGVQIVATDISPSMLNLAKQAEYDALALARGLSTERRNRFFTQLPSGACKLKAEISNRVTFRPLNLLESYTALGKFDIIFCRNVLIYFSAELKTDILQRMSSALNSGGYLFLGASESMAGYCDRYDMQRCSPGIVYQVKAAK